MPASPQLIAGSFSVAALLFWGTSDFVGGYAARRSDAFLMTTIAHASGTLLMVALGMATGSSFPSGRSLEWALAAGFCGGAALAIFYRTLAAGKMGLIAPVSAVLGAAIPTAVGIFMEGLPGAVPLIGFFLAAAGIWLISRPEDGHSTEGIGYAALAGVGFAGFFLCVRQAGNGSVFWIAAISRTGSFAVTAAIVMARRRFRQITPAGVRLGILAGLLDVSGTAVFIRASQAGRLDAAVVISSLYPAITVLLAKFILKERFTAWKAVGMAAALLAVPMIALQ